MLRFALRRLGVALFLIWVVLTATFFFLYLAPGGPTTIYEDPKMSDEQRLRLRQAYGLDRPVWTQYARWLGAAVRGDWGVSITRQRSAAKVLAELFPNTLVLVAGVLVVEYGLGLTLGVASASFAGGGIDRQIRRLSLLLFAVPVFWLGILAIELFAVRWGIFPVGEMTSLDARSLPLPARLADLVHHLALPALVLGLARCGGVVRFVRNGLLEALGQDYVRTARALGLGPWRVVWVHALKNAAGPLVQRFGFTLPGLLSGAVVAEVVFAWPGIGSVAFGAVLERDYPVVLAATGLSGVIVVLSTLMTDLVHAWIDPRVRAHEA
jgi:peptide/nickel transport system permease protein